MGFSFLSALETVRHIFPDPPIETKLLLNGMSFVYRQFQNRDICKRNLDDTICIHKKHQQNRNFHKAPNNILNK